MAHIYIPLIMIEMVIIKMDDFVLLIFYFIVNFENLFPELCFLRLVLLDLSGNKITQLPTELRFMSTLVNLLLDANPLQHPPANVC